MVNKIKDLIYIRYDKATNMSAADLLDWKTNPLSRFAGQTRKNINLSIRLKKTKRNDWRNKEYKWAMRTLAYLKRAKRRRGGLRGKKGYTRNEIAMKNWGFDKKKVKK